jgi:hypothetical protein
MLDNENLYNSNSAAGPEDSQDVDQRRVPGRTTQGRLQIVPVMFLPCVYGVAFDSLLFLHNYRIAMHRPRSLARSFLLLIGLKAWQWSTWRR